MRIGAYQFAVTNDIDANLSIIEKAVIRASKQEVKLLVFPECALTGYPPRDIENSSVIDLKKKNIIIVLLCFIQTNKS